MQSQPNPADIETKQIKQYHPLPVIQPAIAKVHQFAIPTKNPDQIFANAAISKVVVQKQDDIKSQQSNKSVQKRRKNSFLQKLSINHQQQDQKLIQKRKADNKSVFLQNVDYKATRQQLQLLFEDCARIQRITILKNPMTNHPKGCAYISFYTQIGVQKALNLSGVTLRNRTIKVHRKRTNLPGLNKGKKEDLNQNILGMMQNYTMNAMRGRGRGRGR